MSRVLALDPGAKRIGVAVSNSARSMAFPRDAWQREGDWTKALQALCDEESISLVVVGLPLGLSGKATASTEVAQAFCQEVRGALEDIEVIAVDERLTTVSASRGLSGAGASTRDQKGRIDSAAATVLLQGWLDAQA